MAVERAQRILDLAWNDLPRDHRTLLESIGCKQRQAIQGPLGAEVASLYQSAGLRGPSNSQQSLLDSALGVWVQELRLVLVNASHPAFADLGQSSFDAAVARVGWHEWGHALSLHRASNEEVREGQRLLGLSPPGVAGTVRGGNYRQDELTHELVAEIYSLLMARRRRGARGRPKWLDERLWDLVRRTTGWTE